MQTATSETESKSLDLSIRVHHYTLRAPCPKGQGTVGERDFRENGCTACEHGCSFRQDYTSNNEEESCRL